MTIIKIADIILTVVCSVSVVLFFYVIYVIFKGNNTYFNDLEKKISNYQGILAITSPMAGILFGIVKDKIKKYLIEDNIRQRLINKYTKEFS